MTRTPEQIIGRDALVQLVFEGYAVVPAQPTEAVIHAMHDKCEVWDGEARGWVETATRSQLEDAYRAMIGATSEG